jgi:lytic murein transglycosylase
MHRRAFLFASLAALADPPRAPVELALPVTRSGDPGFDAWAQAFLPRALAGGVPEAVARRELAGLTPDERIVAADRSQPELSRPISDYVQRAVSEAKVEAGRARFGDMRSWLGRIEARSGVPGEILVGIWGMESDYGAIQGDRDIVRSLATLAYEGRRRDWAETQLIAALRILADGRIGRERLRGSWAGAMGQTQFIPATYLDTAVDIDGDGRRDIWASAPDALGSAANLLAKAGWARGQSWAREVRLPSGFDYGLSEGPRYGLLQWMSLGARAADGRPWRDADNEAEAQLILPAGARGPAFLAFGNHFVIRAYNNSTAYALAVGLLADRVAGRPGVVTSWPYEAPIPLSDRKGAQLALNRLGYDVGEPDGVIGTKTRAAVRAWQKASGLTPDGHLTPDLAQRLQAQGS